ncbi:MULTISPECIES: hypothetical protein [Eubacterium]|uniref:Uncharacterized protein n=1 Tax=Eubacterium barkeri TaxID=1528 RepID=A0A1H3CLA4_EUBBA|nr:hypothetical protein [Eubacterium barkeri]SDX54941.1 hypothetical protein SAMN04488579_103146 [Eubacterium barkeri]
MKITHPELQKLYDFVLSEKTKECIDVFLLQKKGLEMKYRCDQLWKADQLIGGIGGYCLPKDPIQNPFPSGLKRELYRPLQYVRSEIEITDIRMNARYVIQMSGMHLEAVCRLYLKAKEPFRVFKFKQITLGKSIYKMQKLGDVDSMIIENLLQFMKVYNRSKHEINQDISKERLFTAYDAMVGYFSARSLGVSVLKTINVHESYNAYEILK